MQEHSVLDPREFQLMQLQHVESLIALGEQRAYIIGATNLALLIAYLTNNAPGSESDFSILALIGLSFAVAAIAFATVALWPQEYSYRQLTDEGAEASDKMIYFGTIGRLDKDAYIRDTVDGEVKEVARRIAAAVHYRSRKAREKFTLLKYATIATILQFFPLAASRIIG